MTMITATAIVSLGTPGADQSAHLSAEIDARPDGLNGGRTTFPVRLTTTEPAVSQRPAFLVWSAGVTEPVITVIGGILAAVGRQTTQHDEDIVQFLEPGQLEYTHTLSKPASSALLFEGLHPAGAAVTSTKTVGGRIIAVTLGVASNPAAGAGVWLVGKLSYRATADAYRVTQAVNAKHVHFLVSARQGAA